MSTTITYPAFSADVQATIDKYPALQHLLTNKRAMFAVLLEKFGQAERLKDIDNLDDVLNEVFLSIDTTIQTLGYDSYNWGTEQEPVTISTLFKEAIDVNDATCAENIQTPPNVQYSANLFKNNNDIIYVPSGTAAANMSSCFEGCKCLIGIGDIDWSATTNMSKCFHECSSLKLDKIIIEAPLLINISGLGLTADEIEFKDCPAFSTISTASLTCRKLSGINISLINSGSNFLSAKITLEELHLIEGSYIRYSNSILNYANSSSTFYNILTSSRISNQPIAEIISHIYNWTNNEDNLEDITLTNSFYRRSLILGNNKTSFLSYCIENELFGCTSSDDATSADAKLQSYVEGRGWSWS